MIDYRFGKKDHVYSAKDIRYADVRPQLSLPSLPASWGRGLDFQNGAPPAGWGMLGNGPIDDQSVPSNWTALLSGGAGDCACADPGHGIRMDNHDAGRPVPSITTKTTIDQYTYLGQKESGAGYDPVTGANDNGLQCRTVLDYRLNEGWKDDQGNRHKIGIYVSLEPGNWEHLREACWLFPGLTIGFQVPQSAMDQLNAGKVWSVVPGMMNNILGGHDVIIVGHPWGGLWTVITWGQRQIMTYEFFTTTCDEAYAYIDPDRYSAVTGKTYNGYKDVDLEQYLTMVGQQVSQTGVPITGKIN
jgi:hypothetical protein